MASTIPPLGPDVPELPATITREEGAYVLTCRARIPRRRDEVFPFFADARNLEKITPSLLQFKVVTQGEIEMKPGALIDYRLKIRGVPIKWRTEITAWEPPARFEDRQLKGPYRQWIHEHTFVDEGETTLMQDQVRYKVMGGAIIHWLAVKRDVLKIFTHRNKIMAELFPPQTEG
ncbi:MAG: SRPBCC family protein [Planctomycetota bacterium]|nr:SRPBCC family protein [Planctomycetota bacterium]